MLIEINYRARELTFIGYEEYYKNEFGIVFSFKDKSEFLEKREYKIQNEYELIFFEDKGCKCLRLMFKDKKSVSSVLENTYEYFYLKA